MRNNKYNLDAPVTLGLLQKYKLAKIILSPSEHDISDLSKFRYIYTLKNVRMHPNLDKSTISFSEWRKYNTLVIHTTDERCLTHTHIHKTTSMRRT
jgi:hypothetical protein